jgi:hypothetical protein
MKLFECQACGQPLYFENTRCESCGRRLGYLPEIQEVTALEGTDVRWRAMAAPDQPVRFCANAEHDACNWLLHDTDTEPFCVACRHNRTVPDLSQAENLRRWRLLEVAKRRLFYTLMRLNLPLTRRAEDPQGLAFDFLADPDEVSSNGPSILTGHNNGLVTINIAEADDAERERRRHAMGEPYRTLLGHLRHEIGHYYWNILVRDQPASKAFRRVFGDEREDYSEALKRHYTERPRRDWQDLFVSAYAGAHPWEDFAESWAHYLHMVDTLETSAAFGLRVQPRTEKGRELAVAVDFDPYRTTDLDQLIEAWIPLTFAVNSLNRSMGLPDLYPFVLSPVVVGKLAFIHNLIHGASGRAAPGEDKALLRAVIGGLRSSIGGVP